MLQRGDDLFLPNALHIFPRSFRQTLPCHVHGADQGPTIEWWLLALDGASSFEWCGQIPLANRGWGQRPVHLGAPLVVLPEHW